MDKQNIKVKGHLVRLLKGTDFDFISITDIVKANENVTVPNYILKNYLRNRGNLNFLAIWEKVHNPDFNTVETNCIKSRTGDSDFTLLVSGKLMFSNCRIKKFQTSSNL